MIGIRDLKQVVCREGEVLGDLLSRFDLGGHKARNIEHDFLVVDGRHPSRRWPHLDRDGVALIDEGFIQVFLESAKNGNAISERSPRNSLNSGRSRRNRLPWSEGATARDRFAREGEEAAHELLSTRKHEDWRGCGIALLILADGCRHIRDFAY